MTPARSAQAVTSLIRRLESPSPTREWEHKQRLLAVVREHGGITVPAAADAMGHTQHHTARRLLGELVDEGALRRGPRVPRRGRRGAPCLRWVLDGAS